MTFAALMDALADRHVDAVELTRRALVLARSRGSQVELARNERVGIEVGHAATRAFVEGLSGPLTLDLPAQVRARLRAVAEEQVASVDAAVKGGVEGLVAQQLALALEEALGARFHDHLAAGGARTLDADDLLPFCSPFAQTDGQFRVVYRGDMAPRPDRLGATRPGTLASRGGLRPEVPHGAKLEWVPGWHVLDDLEPRSGVAALVLGTELAWDLDQDRRVFFDVRPRQPEVRRDEALALLAEADARGAHLAMLPELCLDAEGLAAVASWVEDSAENLRVAVCGSAHHRDGEGLANLAVIAAPREDEPLRTQQPKITPFVLRVGEVDLEEDIRRSGHTLRLLTGRWQSLLVLICKDFIDEALARFAADLRASLVLVPACSETTGVFASGASNLAQRRQAHVVVVNQRPGRGEGVSAILARPRREAAAILHTAASPAPGLRWITLCDGPWEPDT
ncbi:MAG: hypothetical protein RLO52_15795 [Sandaracinaceae bacterium]